MIDPPQTKRQAAKRVYGQSGLWNPEGTPYKPERCAYELFDKTSRTFYQCRRKPGHGPAGLYCKQHAKKVEGRA